MASGSPPARAAHARPADGTLVRTLEEATSADTEMAIAAARRAFDTGPWRTTPARDRGDVLLRTAELLQRDKAVYPRAEALDTGKRLVEAAYDIDDVTSCFRYFGGIADSEAGRIVDTGNPDALSRLQREPVGVCGLITRGTTRCGRPPGRSHPPSPRGTRSCSSLPS